MRNFLIFSVIVIFLLTMLFIAFRNGQDRQAQSFDASELAAEIGQYAAKGK